MLYTKDEAVSIIRYAIDGEVSDSCPTFDRELIPRYSLTAGNSSRLKRQQLEWVLARVAPNTYTLDSVSNMTVDELRSSLLPLPTDHHRCRWEFVNGLMTVSQLRELACNGADESRCVDIVRMNRDQLLYELRLRRNSAIAPPPEFDDLENRMVEITEANVEIANSSLRNESDLQNVALLNETSRLRQDLAETNDELNTTRRNLDMCRREMADLLKRLDRKSNEVLDAELAMKQKDDTIVQLENRLVELN
ncbi:28.7 kDa DNA puffC4B-like protein [Spodoptera frugiperda ascovirus 1a]|uniref:28.7 kDa DNA puffC4B-like protein n=1 Tax=Spodoptera frugiperda ascovirus 1a TaxID=113370 RepID=Q0E554_SFAVA|nr:28.7 kDa DNA puffC4B-like protein [Spodoptera frugiperda ascovirus 1a]CAL44647.1 28.7 kDa DNA puffC4B-like protein [Spodoptera frugiperda ascovirus 1a]